MKTNLIRLFYMYSVLCAGAASAATAFTTYTDFPLPAAGSFVVSGTALPDGRLLLWDGDRVYTQTLPGTDGFQPRASGYQGDTAMVALAPDGHTVLLGQGFAGNLYLLDADAPADYTPASVVASVPGHFAGVFLTQELVLLDVGRLDFSGSELQILDLGAKKRGEKSTPGLAVAKGAAYFNEGAKDLVVDKPPFGYSASLAVDAANGIVYAMDSNTRELRYFAVADLISAFNTATPLDWATDGTLVGSVGQFFSGGVAGVRPNGDLIIGGSLGFLQPGGIHLVDPGLPNPASASILETLDPTGNQDFYYVIYNAYTDVITALTFDGTAYVPVESIESLPAADAAALGLLALGLAGAALRRKR